ncbi:hypothetical protein BU16DRAFT_620459 [Lophium mytilinum]|uniref:F-box domain-containing protein n=1 Tax=Lophium mytilinum TaxID=390894 RepID=A0A6A6QHW9_9PEZI|nr:hypothetical protein BU16DRAFT_620459 [Lophium mytilinum]
MSPSSTVPEDGCISGLPQELWDNVVRRLSLRDVKSLRLTSKAFNYTASPYLFTRVCLSSHPLDLEIFTMIATHPAFHRNVQELVWDDSTFRPDILQCRLREKNGIRFWRPIAEKHFEIRRLSQDERALDLALSHGRFPKLNQVTYALIGFRYDLIQTFDPETTRFPSPTWRLWYKQYRSRVGEAFNPAPDMHVASWPSGIDHQAFEVHRGLRVLQKCFARSERSVPTLSLNLDGYNRKGPILRPTLFSPGDTKFQYLRPLGEHVRQFNVKFGDGVGIFKNQGRHLFATLNTMKNLEKVTIQTLRGVMSTKPFEALLNNLRLPELHMFALDRLELQASDLLKFLVRHKNTLRWLFLRNCTISQSEYPDSLGVWTGICDYLRRKHILYEACRFENCFTRSPKHYYDQRGLSRRQSARDNAGNLTTGPLEDFDQWAFE